MRNRLCLPALFLQLVGCLVLGGCGYHVAGSTNLLPKTIHTIAVPAFNNVTTQYKLARFLSEAVSHELIAQTGYAVVADPAKADATLYGSIANMFQSATIADPVTGRSTGAQIIVQMQIRLIGRDGKVLFIRPNMEFRERYEISVTAQQYLDESDGSLARLSRDAARTIVSAILENF